jgi:hypothetical protein
MLMRSRPRCLASFTKRSRRHSSSSWRRYGTHGRCIQASACRGLERAAVPSMREHGRADWRSHNALGASACRCPMREQGIQRADWRCIMHDLPNRETCHAAG